MDKRCRIGARKASVRRFPFHMEVTMQSKLSLFRSIQYLLLAVSVLAMLCTAGIVFSGDTAAIFSDFPLTDGWYYLQGGERIPLTLPACVADDGSGSLTIYHDSLTDELSGKYLTTRAGIYQLQASLDDELLYQYREEGFRRNVQMRSKINCFFIFPEELENRVLALTYTSAGRREYDIPSVTIVDGNSIFLYYFGKNLFSLTIVSLMYLLGLISIWCFFYLKRKNLPEKRFMNIALFLLICGTWCLTDSSIAQLLGRMSPTICYVSFFCFMLFAIPMIYFVKSTGYMARYWIIDCIVSAFYINIIVQLFLNRFCGIELVDMLFVTHILLVVGIGILTYLLIQQYRQEKNQEYLTMFLAFTMIALGGLLALLLYWVVGFPYYQEIYECGILVFIILLLRRIINSTVDNVQAKMEMRVYMRLSKEDGLTSLPNRRAFDEDISALEKRTDYKENAALIFLDLNNLKKTNDSYGHNAGDELIIATARCLQSVFTENSTCYRLGGDEFCVIIKNPSEPAGVWIDRLEAAVKQYNQTHRYPLSLACGCSFLLDGQGRAKTISDWKYEADQNMYADKLQERLRRNGHLEEWQDIEKLLRK